MDVLGHSRHGGLELPVHATRKYPHGAHSDTHPAGIAHCRRRILGIPGMRRIRSLQNTQVHRYYGGYRCLLHLLLLRSRAVRLSPIEHAVDQPARVEYFQSADAVRDRSVTMKNNLPELRARRGWTQGELA